MSWREFKGIPSIQEVQCWGQGLKPEVKLMSLKLYRSTDNFVLATLNVFTSTCQTYSDYSSCVVDTANTHRSLLKVLVYDLEEGESRKYGCKLTVLDSAGDAEDLNWYIVITRTRKFRVLVSSIVL
jgi:hypothetical protein